jgi:hypothetical protein
MPSPQGVLQPDPDLATTSAVRAITRFLRLLRRLGTPVHPLIRTRLREVETGLAVLLDDPGQQPGRHRRTTPEQPASPAPGNHSPAGDTCG